MEAHPVSEREDRNKRRAKSTPARARYAEAYHVILPSAEGDNRRRSVGAAGEETYRGEEETPRGEASPDGAVDGGGVLAQVVHRRRHVGERVRVGRRLGHRLLQHALRLVELAPGPRDARLLAAQEARLK